MLYSEITVKMRLVVEAIHIHGIGETILVGAQVIAAHGVGTSGIILAHFITQVDGGFQILLVLHAVIVPLLRDFITTAPGAEAGMISAIFQSAKYNLCILCLVQPLL